MNSHPQINTLLLEAGRFLDVWGLSILFTCALYVSARMLAAELYALVQAHVEGADQ